MALAIWQWHLSSLDLQPGLFLSETQGSEFPPGTIGISWVTDLIQLLLASQTQCRATVRFHLLSTRRILLWNFFYFHKIIQHFSHFLPTFLTFTAVFSNLLYIFLKLSPIFTQLFFFFLVWNTLLLGPASKICHKIALQNKDMK